MAKNDSIIDTLRGGWKAMSSEQRTIAGILGTIDTAAKAFALRDLARTDAKHIRGPKWIWAPAIGAVNTLGWLAYFAVGKKR